MKVILTTLLFSLSISSVQAVVRTVEVVFVRTAEYNGSNPSQATLAGFQKQIDSANLAYAGSGLQFKFDPVAGFPAIVNNGLLHRDFVLKSGESLNNPPDKQPKVDSEMFTQMKNEYAEKVYPGKLVVYSGAGTQIRYDDKVTMKWVIEELGGAYSNMVDRYVRWHKYDDDRPYLFAHEGGHHLHLYHTFGAQPETVAEWQAIVTDYLSKGGTEANIPALFDADGLSDTPADPGAGLFNLVNGGTCGAKKSLTLSYVWQGQTKYVTFNPDQTNVMGYFFCAAYAPFVSAQQKKRAFNSVEYGNRNYLRSNNLGISIPRYSPNIEAISWGPNRIDLFAAGSDLNLFHKSWDGSKWYPAIEDQEQWEPHYGEAVGVPTVSSWGANRLDIFIRNINGSIKHQVWDGQNWWPSQTAWEDMGGVIAGDLKAISWGKNRIDLFGRGYDGKVYHKAWNGQAWYPSTTGWDTLGNENVTSDPVVVSWGVNRLDIFARSKAGSLLIKSWDGNRWWPNNEDWSDLGGTIPFGSKPAVTAWGPNRLDIVVRGMDNGIYHKAFSNGNWYPSLTGWNSLGGKVTSDPAMVSWSANRLDIVARGTDSRLYHKAWDGQNWWPSLTEWSSLGGYMQAGTTPKIISYKPGRLDIFIRNFNYEIQHKAYENSWYPGVELWEKQGKYID